MLYCFIDANILLQFQPFYQINWLDILKVNEVCLVISPAVIRELEQKKIGDNTRLQKRARNIIQKLDDYSVHEDNQLRQNVYLRILVINPDHQALQEVNCNPNIPDDQIVGTAFLFKEETGNDVMMVSDDTGVRLKAKFLKLPVSTLPENFRLPAEQDSSQKEIQDLKRELLRLQNAQPKLVMYFEDESGNSTNEITYTVDFSDVLYSDAELSDKLTTKLESLKYSGNIDGEALGNDQIYTAEHAVFDLSHLGSIYPTQEEVDEYHSSVEEYIGSEYTDFLLESADYETREKRTRIIKLFLENSGTSPAQNIDVRLHFPDGFTINKSEPQRPEEPEPPSKLGPKDPLDILRRQMFSASIPMIARPPHMYTVAQPRPPLTIRKTNSYEVEWSTDSLKHNFNWYWSELYLTFEPIDKPLKVFEVEYQITADNIPDRIEGKLLIKVQKL